MEEQPSDGCVVLPPVGKMVSRNTFLGKLARLCTSADRPPHSSPPSLKPLMGYEISFKARLYVRRWRSTIGYIILVRYLESSQLGGERAHLSMTHFHF